MLHMRLPENLSFISKQFEGLQDILESKLVSFLSQHAGFPRALDGTDSLLLMIRGPSLSSSSLSDSSAVSVQSQYFYSFVETIKSIITLHKKNTYCTSFSFILCFKQKHFTKRFNYLNTLTEDHIFRYYVRHILNFLAPFVFSSQTENSGNKFHGVIRQIMDLFRYLFNGCNSALLCEVFKNLQVHIVRLSPRLITCACHIIKSLSF